MLNKNKLNSNKRLLYFFLIRKRIYLKNLFYQNKNIKHLFILSPPFSGSTLLNQIIESSKNVSCNNNIGLREGQHLPIVNQILFTKDRWDPEKKINWNKIHNIWNKYWDNSKKIFLEKSPPNICRAIDIEKEFKNSYFICLVRNPYAQIEGHIRRYNTSVEIATKLYIKYLKYQKKNILNLQNIILISYEDITEKTMEIKKQIINFIPEIKDINTKLTFSAHNLRGQKLSITNLNAEKIKNLKTNEIKKINSILSKNKDLLNFFNYKEI